MTDTKPRPMDRDELQSHVVGFSMHLEDVNPPLGALQVGPPVTVPGSGWGQVARVRCATSDEEWWVSVIEGTELPGQPVWVWLSDGHDRQQLLRETTVKQLRAHAETPTTVLLGKALPVLHHMLMGEPVWREW